MKDIAGCDWILEAVVENIDIKKKKSVFAEVEKFLQTGNAHYFKYFRNSYSPDE